MKILMRPLQDSTLYRKILLLYGAFFVVATLAGNVILSIFLEDSITSDAKENLRKTVDLTTNLVESMTDSSIRNYLRAIAESSLTAVEHIGNTQPDTQLAQQQAAELLLRKVVGKTGYIYVLNSRGVLDVHPKIKGRNLSSYGFIQQQIKNKIGYLEYDWQNPDDPAPRPKALYMVYYEPWDWIVSVSSYRAEFLHLLPLDDIRKQLKSIRFDQTGYFYVIDSRGEVVIHPALEGQNVLDARDAGGKRFVREMVAKKRGVISYSWKNPGEPISRKKIVAYDHIPALDWIVAASTYSEEIYQPVHNANLLIAAIAALLVLLALPLTAVISQSITHPLRALSQSLQVSAQGDYSTRVTVESKDEIGQLGSYFNDFMEKLEKENAERLLAEESLRVVAEEKLRQEMQIALKESEQRTAADIINFLPDATVVIDREGKVIAWNLAIEEMTSVRATEILGKGNYEHALPFRGEREPILADLVFLPYDEVSVTHPHVQRNGDTLIGESYTLHRESGELHLSATASPLHDARGNVTGAIESIRDNTARKKSEEELAGLYRQVKREREFFESVILNSPVAIVVTGVDNEITTWNPAAEKLFGHSRAEAMGRHICNVLETEETQGQPDSETEKDSEWLGHAFTQRTRKDGTPIDVELLKVPIMVDGERLGSIAMYHDITEIQRARRTAESATIAKSQFLANMSHEIRTPLNGVIGMTSLVLDTPLNDEQRDFVSIIRSSGESLLSILNDILDFSKIEAGALELEVQPFDLRYCIDTAVDLVAYRASEKGIELLANIETDVPIAVMGDVTRLRQVFANLLGNSVKFTETGEVEIAVTKKDGGNKEGDECTLHFSVRDTGVGIPEERRHRLFQIFSQVDSSTTRKFGGTGLGLTICKRIVELIGGDIWVESAGEGAGSTFHVVLPFTVAGADSYCIKHESSDLLRGKAVLVVDDNATNRLIVDRIFRSWGMKPVECSSAFEALRKLDSGLKVDVAVLDVHMPEMDGITLTQRLTEHAATQELPIVLLTSLGDKVSLPNGANVKPSGCLHKPVKPSQLYDALVDAMVDSSDQPATGSASDGCLDADMGERHPLRILLAEDHLVNQKVMKLMLERLGYRIDIVANGVEVLQAFERRDYDVILMDIQMPEMNGLEATQRLRAELAPQRQPRIIALTANALGGEKEKYLAAGMNDYLSKPVNTVYMRGALEKCLPLEEVAATGSTRTASCTRSVVVPSEVAPRQETIDAGALREYFPYEGEDMRFVLDLAADFLADTAGRIGQMRTSVDRGDAQGISRVAHMLKGASMNFGARRFSMLCGEMEHMGKAGELSGALEKMRETQEEFAKVQVELPSVLEGMLR